MKKILMICALAIVATTAARGQRLMVGERAPDLKIGEWLNQKPAQGTARLIEFFHSSDGHSRGRLATLDSYSKIYGTSLTVIIVTRETKATIEKSVLSSTRTFSVGIDDNGKTFAAFNVQYVPFCVLVDARGRVRWFGNPSSLNAGIISNVLK